MKLIQKIFLPRFINIDFLEKDQDKVNKGQANVNLIRDKVVGKVNGSQIDNSIEIISNYEFDFNGQKAKFVFVSRFDILLDINDSVKYTDVLKEDAFDEKISAIVHPQESLYIKRILFDFGLNVGAGFPIGDEFSV